MGGKLRKRQQKPQKQTLSKLKPQKRYSVRGLRKNARQKPNVEKGKIVVKMVRIQMQR